MQENWSNQILRRKCRVRDVTEYQLERNEQMASEEKKKGEK